MDESTEVSLNKKVQFAARKTLAVLIAEDQEPFISYYREFFGHELRTWPLFPDHLDYKFEIASDLETFKKRCSELQKSCDIVYTILDLKMPVRPDVEQDVPVSNKIVSFAYQAKKNHQNPEAFEFCIVSGSDSALESLEEDKYLEEHLNSLGINLVRKPAPGNERIFINTELRKIFQDIKSLVYNNINQCIYTTSSEELHTLWIGNHQGSIALLENADHILNRNARGLFLIFSSALGYEREWFNFLCSLLKVQGKYLKLGDEGLSNLKNLQNSNQPLLISGLDKLVPPEAARMHRTGILENLAQFIDESKLNTESRLIFLHFPLGKNPLDVTKRIKSETIRKFLIECLQSLGIDTEQKDIGGRSFGLQLQLNERIISFPLQQELLDSQLIENTLSTLQKINRDKYSVDMTIDWEIPKLLTTLLQKERNYHLYELQEKINYEFQRLKDKDKQPRELNVSNAKYLRDLLSSPKCYKARIELLYRFLKRDASASLSQSPSEARRHYEGLQVILDLYTRLDKLEEQRKRLEDQSNPNDQTELKQLNINKKHQTSLNLALNFLTKIFLSIDNLKSQIKEFGKHLRNEDWEIYYPSLRRRSDWQDLVARLEVLWPWQELPIHPEIDHYLGMSKVTAEIKAKPLLVLDDFQDLKEEWEIEEKEWKEKRDKMQKKLVKREKAILAAQKFVNEEHYPSLLHFNWKKSEVKNTYDLFNSIIQWFAYVAICENKHKFNYSVCDPGQLEQQLKSDLAFKQSRVDLIKLYIVNLSKKPELKQSSYFKYWTSSWNDRFEHQDIIYKIPKILSFVLENYPNIKEKDNLILATYGEEHSSISAITMLDILLCLNRRNFLDFSQFWVDFNGKKKVFDTMKGFLHSVHNESTSLMVKSAAGESKPWRFNSEISLYGELFIKFSDSEEIPLSEFIQLNPDDHTVWAFMHKIKDQQPKWDTLTKSPETKIISLKPSMASWLPKESPLKSAEIKKGKKIEYLSEEDSDTAELLLKRKVESGEYDVFLSYKNNDVDFADQISSYLKNRGIHVYDTLPTGANLEIRTEEGFNKPKCCVQLLGPEIGRNQENEIALWNQYYSDKVPMIPVIHPDCPPDYRLPATLITTDRIDGRSEPSLFKKILEAITQAEITGGAS